MANLNLEERIAHLEGRLEQDEKSLTKRFSLWGGLLALFVSILIGGFQIFEYTVLRYQAAKEANIVQLGSYIRRISELNADIARMSLLADTPEKQARANAESKIIVSEKLVVVRLADRILQAQPTAGGFATYLTMSYEMQSQGSNAQALAYSKTALEVAATLPERIESMRYVARTLFAPGASQNVSAARTTFDQAQTLAAQEQSFLGPQLSMGLYIDRIVSEILFGDCNQAAQQLAHFQQKMVASGQPHLLHSASAEITYNLRGNTRCSHVFPPMNQ